MSATGDMPALLTAQSVRKSFAGVHALRGVSFDLRPGEVHALVGENGAGKSTLIRIMTGAEIPDAGSLAIDGRAVAQMTPAVARAFGIAAIYQQPALFPDLTVAENIAIVLEPPRPWARVDWPARARRAAALIDRLGAALDPERRVGELSMPEQQLVEIAKAVGAEARVVIMDEPTASLTAREVGRLFEIISRLREAGVGVIYISHRLDEVMAIADRITVLRDGKTAGTYPRGAISAEALISRMVGRELETVYPARRGSPGDVVLEVQGLSSRAAGCADISFDLRRGEIVGVAGLVGSGRTELAEALFGLRGIDRGAIRINGRPIRISSPAEAKQAGIAYVPEDRRRHGVIGELSIAGNISLASLERVSRAGFLRSSSERRRANRYMRRLGIKARNASSLVDELSGGNQQKVALARWLATHPAILILDEPTQGIDIGAKAEVHALMQTLVEKGIGVIMISSELPEILAMSDRIVVMRAGQVAGTLSRHEATAARVLSLALEDSAA